MKKQLLYFFPGILLFCSCSSFYTSNSINVPLIKAYNESTLNANIGMNGLDIQGASAIDHNLSIMGNFSVSSNSRDSIAGRHHEHLVGELAIGHFGHLTMETTYEVYAGFGRGYLQAYNQFDFFGPQNTLARGQFTRYFLQGNVGRKIDKIEFGGALKTSYFNMFEVKSQDVTIRQTFNSIFLEPVVFARFDLQNVQVTTQLGYSYDVANNFQLSQQNLILNVGIMYKIKRYYY
ncbi:MAG: hypothetical protein ACOCXH_09080 [Cyclobacteriaceae bacterium]